MVLMHVHALEFNLFTVEQKSTVGVKLHFTDARCCHVNIGHQSVHLDGRFHLIQIGVAGAPQMRSVKCQHLFAAAGLFAFQVK